MSRLLILAWASNNGVGLRIGFVISKRISKHAVERNHLKRLLGEAIRSMLAELSGNWDIVITAREQIIGADLPVLRQDLTTLLRRAKLLAPK